MSALRPAPAVRPRGLPRAKSRGSVLIVALLLMVVLALGLTTYLNVNLGSARFAQRSHRQNAAFHLAEAGAEEALWSFNRAASHPHDAWNGWSVLDPAARRRFDGFDFGGNTLGSVQVQVNSIVSDALRPTVVALASVESPGTTPVTKMIEVTLARRSRFAAALMAKDAVSFAGANASVDSWNSDPDGNPATPPVPYSAAARSDRGSVASTSVQNTAMLINQANVWGYVATGGPAPQVGVNGSITGQDTPAGVLIDPARVTTDFTADFPPLTAPVDGTPLATIGATLGTAGTATRWRCAEISLSGSQTLTILGDVTLVLTAGPGADAISVTGNAGIIIPAGSSLTVYAEGDIKVAGQGLANSNVSPATCQIYGVSASLSGQAVHLAGNGALAAVVYAPNAGVKLNGNGDMMGSIVGLEITLTGNAAFHYDESLAAVNDGMPFGIVRWREINREAERQSQLGKFSGW